MEEKDYRNLSDEDLKLEKEKLKKSKFNHALLIGFLAGIFLFALIGIIRAGDFNFGFLIALFIPLFFIRKILKNSTSHKELEAVLKERGLY